MSFIELQSVIQKLPHDMLWKLKGWLDEYLEKIWDEQIARDIAGNKKFQSFISEIDLEIEKENFKPFP